MRTLSEHLCGFQAMAGQPDSQFGAGRVDSKHVLGKAGPDWTCSSLRIGLNAFLLRKSGYLQTNR